MLLPVSHVIPSSGVFESLHVARRARLPDSVLIPSAGVSPSPWKRRGKGKGEFLSRRKSWFNSQCRTSQKSLTLQAFFCFSPNTYISPRHIVVGTRFHDSAEGARITATIFKYRRMLFRENPSKTSPPPACLPACIYFSPTCVSPSSFQLRNTNFSSFFIFLFLFYKKREADSSCCRRLVPFNPSRNPARTRKKKIWKRHRPTDVPDINSNTWNLLRGKTRICTRSER